MEAGVRNLEREIAGVIRKVATAVAENPDTPDVTVRRQDVSRYLGVRKHLKDGAREKDEVGAATGLAWTSVGGVTLTIEVGLMHGKLKDKEKNAVMQDFKDKKFSVLVSTTVIEVGVDVPDASVMVIYNAERFGLSQIHQLRGRVGRGTEKSYCFLLSDMDSETAKERLCTLKNTSDGFKIAEKDLEMRGGGDFLGTRQSGRMLSEIKNLKYGAQVIFEAKKLCDETFDNALDDENIRRAALKKYESLKDVVMN